MERTDELKERIRQQPLNDRLEESRRRIGDMCSKGRCPKMTIPVQHDDDDFYINTTLADAQATIAALQARVKELEQIAISHDQSMRYITGQAKRTHEKLTTVQATLTQRTAECDTARRRVDELEAREVDVVLLREDLERRTAELEAANKRIHDLECQHQDLCLRNQILRDRPDLPVERASFHAEVVRMQAELERVRGELQSAEAGYFVAERELQGANNKYDELRTLILALPKVEGEIMVSESLVLAEDPDMCSDMSDKEEATAYAALLKRRQGMEG